jgi:amino acid transporter
MNIADAISTMLFVLFIGYGAIKYAIPEIKKNLKNHD